MNRVGMLLGALCLSLAVRADAQGDRAPRESFLKFKSEQKCSHDDALSILKRKLIKNPSPTGDGITPWPRLMGAWVNNDRGVVVVIKGEESQMNERTRGLVRVRIYHLCSNILMAEGARFIEKTDFKSESLVIRVRFATTESIYPYVDAYFTAISDRSGKTSYVDTQLVSPTVNERRLNDRFKLIQP